MLSAISSGVEESSFFSFISSALLSYVRSGDLLRRLEMKMPAARPRAIIKIQINIIRKGFFF